MPSWLDFWYTRKGGFSGEKQDKRGHRLCYEDGRRVKCAPKGKAAPGGGGETKPPKEKPAPKPKPGKHTVESLFEKIQGGVGHHNIDEIGKALQTLKVDDLKKLRDMVKAGKGKSKDKKEHHVEAIKAAVGVGKPIEPPKPPEPEKPAPASSKDAYLKALATPNVANPILRAMRHIEPQVGSGALVLIPELRQHFPGLSKQEFDKALIDLQKNSNDGIDFQRHDNPGIISAADRDQLVSDDRGNHYVGLGVRRGAPHEVMDGISGAPIPTGQEVHPPVDEPTHNPRHKQAHDTLMGILGPHAEGLDLGDPEAVKAALRRAMGGEGKPYPEVKPKKDPKPARDTSHLQPYAEEVENLKHIALTGPLETTRADLDRRMQDLHLDRLNMADLVALGRQVHAEHYPGIKKAQMINNIERTVLLIHETRVGAAS